jgi:hypothetical protein
LHHGNEILAYFKFRNKSSSYEHLDNSDTFSSNPPKCQLSLLKLFTVSAFQPRDHGWVPTILPHMAISIGLFNEFSPENGSIKLKVFIDFFDAFNEMNFHEILHDMDSVKCNKLYVSTIP